MSKKVFKKCLKCKTRKKRLKVNLYVNLENKKPAAKEVSFTTGRGIPFRVFFFSPVESPRRWRTQREK